MQRCSDHHCILERDHKGACLKPCTAPYCTLSRDHPGPCVKTYEPSLPRNENLACFSKKAYGTREHAQRVAAECFEKRGHWLRVYQCETCNGFHLTHKGALPKPGWRDPKPPKAGRSDNARGIERDRRRRYR